MVRVGPKGDGGKWVCNPWYFPDDCVVFSLGVGGNNGFEKELHSFLPGRCRSFSFDPDTNYSRLFQDLPAATFKPYNITARTDRRRNAVSLFASHSSSPLHLWCS